MKFYRDWFGDLISQTQNVIGSADALRLSDAQRRSLTAEAALYSDLAELLNTGVPPPPSAPVPVDPSVIEQVRAGVDRWTGRLWEADDIDLTDAQRSDFTESARISDLIRAYLASYPTAGT